MKYTEFQFRVNDGELLFAREWQPERNPFCGVVFLVHGLGEHSGRYDSMAHTLTEAGYVLTAFDQRGHGKSPGRRGDAPSYDTLLQDIDCFRREFAQRLPVPDLPSFLYGHSMGGNLVLNYVQRRQPKFSGVIVTSPWLRLAVDPPALLKLCVRFLSKLWPTLSISNGLAVQALSHDPRIIEAYQEDPLVHCKISARLFTEMDEAGRWAMEKVEEFKLPLLIMHGGGDLITSAEATRSFAARVPSDCTLNVWEGLYHELHNEPQKEEVLAYIINWLK